MVFPDYLDTKNNYSLRDRTLPLRCKTADFATIIHLLSIYMLWRKKTAHNLHTKYSERANSFTAKT
jgi:hypothetical protein